MRSIWLLPLALACGPDDAAPRDRAGELSVEVVAGSSVPNHRQLVVGVSDASSIWVDCARDDDPADVLLAESPEPAEAHVVDLFGLAAGFTYTCTAHAPEAQGLTAEVAVDVPALGGDFPTFTVERGDGVESWGAWTLANTTRGCFALDQPSHAFVVDDDGNVRWTWDFGVGYIVDVDATWLPEAGAMHLGGGWGVFDEVQGNRGRMVQVDLAGNIGLERSVPTTGLGYNHHSQPMPDGQILNLTATREYGANGGFWYGIGVELYDPATDAATWTWSSQALVDAGVEEQHATFDSPYHANSVSFVDDPLGPAMYLSLYLGREIWRIDRTTGERTHVIGPYGDMTLLDPAGAPLPDEEWFWGQHDPQYTVVGDKVRALLHDNGADRPNVAPYSRVAEVELDLVAHTVTLLWTWTEPGWFNPIVGDADRLPNGNVLITRGFQECWTPASADASQLLEITADGEVAWRLRWDDPAYITYRGERLDGCAIFASAEHCPAVAERLAELAQRTGTAD